MAEQLKPIGHFLGQLDTTDYDSRAAMLKAARALRATAKRRIDADKKVERDFKNRQLTMSEKRGMVRAGTHRWCHGCRKRGYLQGRDGVVLPHGACRGDGLIRVRGGGGSTSSRPAKAPKRRRGRARRPSGSVTRRTAVYAAGCTTFVGGAGAYFGIIGQVVAIVLVVLFTVLKLIGMTVRVLGAVAK